MMMLAVASIMNGCHEEQTAQPQQAGQLELSMKTFRLGGILVNFFIGEPTTPVGLNRIKDSLKARSGLHAIIAAPSNDYLLYVPSTEQYEESSRLSNYERLCSLFGPETDELLVGKALDSAQGLY